MIDAQGKIQKCGLSVFINILKLCICDFSAFFWLKPQGGDRFLAKINLKKMYKFGIEYRGNVLS